MLAASPTSRRRLATGAAAVAALTAGGLALTASQTGAAVIRADVQAAAAPTTTGPASHPIANVAVTEGGQTTVHDDLDSAAIDRGVAAGQRIAIKPAVPGGSRMSVKMPDDPTSLVEIQNVPAVTQAKCGIGKGKPATMLIGLGKGPQRLIVVCTDRLSVMADQVIEAQKPVTVMAGDTEHDAFARALAGLIDARARMVADTGIAAADRARGLAAIDTSIAEMRGQLARRD